MDLKLPIEDTVLILLLRLGPREKSAPFFNGRGFLGIENRGFLMRKLGRVEMVSGDGGASFEESGLWVEGAETTDAGGGGRSRMDMGRIGG